VTAKRFELAKSEVISSGLATALFGKPFSPSELLEAVEQNLGLSTVG
jgi:hypothetical protein